MELLTMGTPLPANEPGDLCPSCWGPGLTFGDGPTPRVLEITLLGFSPGTLFTAPLGQLLLTPHLLEQTDQPCRYQISDGTFFWELNYNFFGTSLDVRRISDQADAFFANAPQECLLTLVNEVRFPINRIIFDGFANITWSLAGL